MHSEPYVHALGALTGNMAMQQVRPVTLLACLLAQHRAHVPLSACSPMQPCLPTQAPRMQNGCICYCVLFCLPMQLWHQVIFLPAGAGWPEGHLLLGVAGGWRRQHRRRCLPRPVAVPRQRGARACAQAEQGASHPVSHPVVPSNAAACVLGSAPESADTAQLPASCASQ
jgi:hypothetical protein